eukprot:478280-Amphidinium_carterae.2
MILRQLQRQLQSTTTSGPVDDAETNRATLQQLLAISYHYAPKLFDAMKQHKLTNLREPEFEEEQIQAYEEILKKEKIMEFYINGTDDKHAWYNFHTDIEDAINDFINIYMYNYPQQGQQLLKHPYYLTVVHTTERLLRVLSDGLRDIQSRTGKWFQRKTLDHQYQIQGDRIGREGNRTINIGKYMEIKTTYRNTVRDVIVDKPDYKQRHYHDYSVITTDIYVDEEYARQMIIDIYAQATKKADQPQQFMQQPHQPPHENRFIRFMIQNHSTKIERRDAGLPQQQINLAFGHFDERAAQHFTNPTVRNLADMDNALQRMRADRR